MDFKPTPLDEIPKIYEILRTTFQSGKTLPLNYRRAQLLALARPVQENTDALLGAYNTDLGRYKLETNLPEMSPIGSGAVLAANSLEDWTNPERPKVKDPVRATWSTTIHKAPKGILVLQKTRSGQLILKDVFTQLAVYEILFGRCGNSGYGWYLGKFSFDSFTHLRGSINVPFVGFIDPVV